MKLADPLAQLFQTVSRSKEPLPALSYRLEMRVLAAWHEPPARPTGWEETSFSLRALVCAAICAALCLLPLLLQNNDPLTDSIQVADEAVPWETTP